MCDHNAIDQMDKLFIYLFLTWGAVATSLSRFTQLYE